MKKITDEKNSTEPQPLCGAKTRAGIPCKEPRVRCPDGSYRPRCYAHGCAPGAGGQIGNKNAYKHGFYTAENIAERKESHRQLRKARKLLKKSNAMLKKAYRLANSKKVA